MTSARSVQGVAEILVRFHPFSEAIDRLWENHKLKQEDAHA